MINDVYLNKVANPARRSTDYSSGHCKLDSSIFIAQFPIVATSYQLDCSLA